MRAVPLLDCDVAQCVQASALARHQGRHNPERNVELGPAPGRVGAIGRPPCQQRRESISISAREHWQWNRSIQWKPWQWHSRLTLRRALQFALTTQRNGGREKAHLQAITSTRHNVARRVTENSPCEARRPQPFETVLKFRVCKRLRDGQ